MRIGTVTSAPAVRRLVPTAAPGRVGPVQPVSAAVTDEDLLDELTGSDRALLAHLYDDVLDLDALPGTAAGALAAEIARERARGAVSGRRDLTAEDLRRMIGRLTATASRPVPVAVQRRLLARLGAPDAAGHLDVVL